MPNARQLTTLSYAEAADTLGNRASKALAPNTKLVRVDAKTIGVQLHATIVVEIHSCGNYTLYSGGYRTMTTKQRINAVSPASVHQTRGVWYIGEVPFVEGMIVNRLGKVA